MTEYVDRNELRTLLDASVESNTDGGDWNSGWRDGLRYAIQRLDAFRDAERLRSLAATFDNRLNRGKTFTGAQVAAMLRDGKA